MSKEIVLILVIKDKKMFHALHAVLTDAYWNKRCHIEPRSLHARYSFSEVDQTRWLYCLKIPGKTFSWEKVGGPFQP